MIPGSANPLLLATAAPTGYNIERSLRFNSSDSAYLSKQYNTAPQDSKKQTFSFWVKKAKNNGTEYCFYGYDGSSADATGLLFASSGNLIFRFGGAALNDLQTSQVFRDPSSWYHIIISIDTTQATTSNRVIIYVNGEQVTAFVTANYPNQNASSQFALANANNKIAALWNSTGFANLYLTDIHFIDGQALDPTSFTEVDADTGQLVPIEYTGTYGTNGFHLPFSDNSTAAALGTDTSGNSNTWTVNNISVTAGTGNDSLVDTPTSYGTGSSGGDVRGNYATLNPLLNGSGTPSDGNLLLTGPSSTWGSRAGTIAISSGKWYFEVTATSGATSQGVMVGITKSLPAGNHLGIDANGYAYFSATGNKWNNGSGTAYGATWTDNDVIGCAFDADTGTLTFYKNGTSQGTAYSSLSSTIWFLGLSCYGTATAYINFGQRPFAYTAPSGFKALCTTNLPAPLVAKPNTVFDVKLYTGTGSSQTISGLAFSPDLVWTKSRNNTFEHTLSDTVRGANKQLYSSLTNAETSNTDAITAFNSDGFTVGANGGTGFSSTTYVGWAWDAGSSTVTNEDGSITSQVRANASAGFSVVTYTGDLTGAGNSTIGHGLGVAPSLVITKSRSNSSRWVVQHVSLGSDDYLSLNTTDAVADSVAVGAGALPKPTSTVFYGSWLQGLNNNGETFVAYCFAPVDGYSSFGSYTGNGSADGPFVYTGFRPRWIMVKSSSATSFWLIYDTARDPSNLAIRKLGPNVASVENSNADLGTDSQNTVDILSNGFKMRELNVNTNASGATYIYAAFAEHPFQFSRAR